MSVDATVLYEIVIGKEGRCGCECMIWEQNCLLYSIIRLAKHQRMYDVFLKVLRVCDKIIIR